MVSESLFQSLSPFVWPKYREEGPPEFVQALLLGRTFLGEDMALNAVAKTVLELTTIGYRPATTFAVLRILSESPKIVLHGMQIGRELEKRFDVQEGWFTRTRYYTDRVGKLLTLLTRLDIIQEVVRKDPKGGRSFPAYQMQPSLLEPVKVRIEDLSRGGRISLFSNGAQIQNESHAIAQDSLRVSLRECLNCKTVMNSVSARYCERCGKPLKLDCPSCKSRVDAIYDFCPMCGNRLLIAEIAG